MSPGSDEAARLVFADSLTATGDPQGEYIVLECELARGGYDRARGIALRTRAQELLERHRAAWHDTGGLGTKAVLRRGCIEELTIDAAVFVARAAEIAARFPWLSHVHLTGLDHRTSAYGDALFASDWHPIRDRLERALAFTTSFEPVDAMVTWEKRAGFDYEEHTDAVMHEIVEWLIATNGLARLTGLQLTYLERRTLPLLAAAPAAASLRDLRLFGEIFDDDAPPLLADTALRPERLALHDRSAGAPTIARALSSPLLEDVHELEVTLASSLDVLDVPALDRVTDLTIHDSINAWAPRDLDLAPLFDPKHLASLRVLRLHSRFVHRADMLALVRSPLAQRLEAVRFMGPAAGDLLRGAGWDGVVL